MSRLDAATRRFDAALEALDKMGLPFAELRKSMDDVAPRLAAVSEERDRLRARVRELEEESRSLNHVTTAVESRLDGAIAEIRTALSR